MVHDHMIVRRLAKFVFDNNPILNIFAMSMYQFMQQFSLKIKVVVFSNRSKFGFPLNTTASQTSSILPTEFKMYRTGVLRRMSHLETGSYYLIFFIQKGKLHCYQIWIHSLPIKDTIDYKSESRLKCTSSNLAR